MAKRNTNGGTAAPDGHEDSGAAGCILEDYLAELKAIRATGAGVPETSYYPALSNLLGAVGKTLKPKVRCIMQLKQQGAGMPDSGLFTSDQCQRQSDGTPKAGQLPARGAIEVKGTKPDVRTIAASEQVKEYLKTYGIVIVTNLREFLIVERGANGQPVEREAFALADSEQDFWQHKAAHPRATAQQKGATFVEFINRACLHAAPLTNPKDVAWFLASYARDALFRVELQKELPALQTVRSALEDALGMKFTDEKGEHFFRSTLVQTLFYGVFSAWVRWHKDNPGPQAKFDWRTAEWSLHVPFIRTLYRQVAEPHQLGQLELVETLDWAAGVLNRVDRGEFFNRFEDDHAVQYFYEPFLEAYDPELRKELGVWYTPPEIVKYQVARVDRVLREELDLADGLADPNVIVLDPCCGTGAYLVEVLHSIAATLRDKGGDALVASDLKQAAMNRVFGFEIMPAPFVVSHLQLGLMLQAQGAPLSQKKGERVGVYLTNALTGWEPPKGVKATAPFQQFTELQEEKDAAEQVKRDKKILVVLGNPPYNAFAGVSPDEEQGLVEPYKGVYYSEKLGKKGQPPKRRRHYLLSDPISKGGWGIKKFNLDDLYVRFFRLAERRIAEMSGRGVVSFISNFSYLGDPSFVVLRQRFLAEFDKLWLDCMNGDSRETGKLTPEGKPDPSVFSTDYNREGIRVGTAVCVLVKKPVAQPLGKAFAPPGAAMPQPRLLAKPGKSEYRRNLPHLQVEGKPIFLTFCTRNRWVLPESVRSKVLAHCLHDHDRKIYVFGAIVMPDHVHMVFMPLHDPQGNPYTLAEITNGIKGASAHSVNKTLGRKGSVWQDESYDHVLRTDESTSEKVDYICANPIRKGLCRHESEYPWLWREWVEGRNHPSSVAQPPPPVAQPPSTGLATDTAVGGGATGRKKPTVRFRHF